MLCPAPAAQVSAARCGLRSALGAAKAEVDRLEVHAPFAGGVDKVFVEAESWVQPGTEVASLLALDPIIVVAEINELDEQSVTKGTPASVIFGDGTTATGRVRHIRHEAAVVTRTLPIEVAIPNPGATIPVGISAEINLSEHCPGGRYAAFGDHAGRQWRPGPAGADQDR
jgi:membrane fusion protein, multidrug efflux system